jgi:hypothetical protein
MGTRYLIGAAIALVVGGAALAASVPPKAPVQRYTVEEARQSVQMLADYYRHALRETLTTFVSDGKPPAATVMKRVFAEMAAKGWPEARWLSVNGNPANRDNLPRDAFETSAARALRHGETLFEKVEGDRFRAAAPVPFTGGCLKCHWGDKPNEYLGAISFSVALNSPRGVGKTEHAP